MPTAATNATSLCISRSSVRVTASSNVCRSPIAEGVAKKWLSERHGVEVQDLEQIGYKVQSRGKRNARDHVVV